MTSRNWLNAATAALTEAGALDAALDCEWMLADALGIGRARLRFRLDVTLTDSQLVLLSDWLAKRLGGAPLQYAQGRAYFMGHEFSVDERVLIPRQDTEVLCERALALITDSCRVLDLCTGSGAIAISIKLARPDAEVWASDISADALDVARHNARTLGADVVFREGDLFRAVAGEKFDLVVSNPPYISESDMVNLQREVRREPGLALMGGHDGLDFYRRIAAELLQYLNSGGHVAVEVGIGQAPCVAALFGGAEIERDLCGVERVVYK